MFTIQTMRNRAGLIGALCAFAIAGSAVAEQGGNPQKCEGSAIANGPFVYGAIAPDQTTFSGSGGAPVSARFTVTAPSAAGSPAVFPGQGAANACAERASAEIGVVAIQKVGDASGNSLDLPLTIDPNSNLGVRIAGAFAVVPTSWIGFAPGENTAVDVTVSDPDVAAEDYGEYAITFKAKADGYGIGAGPGVSFTLVLSPPTLTDKTPPVVSVTKPEGDQILGVIGLELQAYDPSDSAAASGLASMSAKVSSAGGTVSNVPIGLTFDQTLPVAAGVTAKGTGSFIPTGGSGLAGTTDALAFTADARSGIGTYTVNAQARDVAGNTGFASKTFAVTYAVSFVKVFSSPNCSTGGNAACLGQFQFTVNRSNVTSDGAFMFDHTVVVKLVPAGGGSAVATHVYGSGDIKSFVQITADAGTLYQTHFRRGDFGAGGPGSYKAEVYFLDVDNNLVRQGTSASVTF